MSTSSWTQNKIVLAVLLVVFGIPFFSCCVCTPMVAILMHSEFDEANELWQQGKQAEAVEIYAKNLDRGLRTWDEDVLERVVTYYHDAGEKDRAKHFCRVAVDSNTLLSPQSELVRKFYEQEKAAYEAELAKPTGFAARVMPASKRQIEAIASGLQEDFMYYPSEAYTVKASSYKNAYYVVMPISGPGIPKKLGAWFRFGTPNEDGMVLAANVAASVFSVFPKGSNTKANAWHDDKDCKDLLKHVKKETGVSY